MRHGLRSSRTMIATPIGTVAGSVLKCRNSRSHARHSPNTSSAAAGLTFALGGEDAAEQAGHEHVSITHARLVHVEVLQLGEPGGGDGGVERRVRALELVAEDEDASITAMATIAELQRRRRDQAGEQAAER